MELTASPMHWFAIDIYYSRTRFKQLGILGIDINHIGLKEFLED